MNTPTGPWYVNFLEEEVRFYFLDMSGLALFNLPQSYSSSLSNSWKCEATFKALVLCSTHMRKINNKLPSKTPLSWANTHKLLLKWNHIDRYKCYATLLFLIVLHRCLPKVTRRGLKAISYIVLFNQYSYISVTNRIICHLCWSLSGGLSQKAPAHVGLDFCQYLAARGAFDFGM